MELKTKNRGLTKNKKTKNRGGKKSFDSFGSQAQSLQLLTRIRSSRFDF